MPYIESDFKSRVRKIRNSVTLIQDGITGEIVSADINRNDLIWLLEQAEKVEKQQQEIEKRNDVEFELKIGLQNLKEEIERLEKCFKK